MKYMELKGYKTNKKHLISIKSISNIESPNDDFSIIYLSNGHIIEVIEDINTIKEFILYQDGHIINQEFINNSNANDKMWFEYSSNMSLNSLNPNNSI